MVINPWEYFFQKAIDLFNPIPILQKKDYKPAIFNTLLLVTYPCIELQQFGVWHRIFLYSIDGQRNTAWLKEVEILLLELGDGDDLGMVEGRGQGVFHGGCFHFFHFSIVLYRVFHHDSFGESGLVDVCILNRQLPTERKTYLILSFVWKTKLCLKG